jgi:hypothetical protein
VNRERTPTRDDYRYAVDTAWIRHVDHKYDHEPEAAAYWLAVHDAIIKQWKR